MFKIKTAPKKRTVAKDNKLTVVNGFEVWKDKGSWHAVKHPRAMEASTRKAILKMINDGGE